MSIVQLSPLRAGTLVWQPEPAAWTLTVCVKATFELVPNGTARLAAVNEPVGPDRFEGPGDRVLRAPNDLVPFKPRADVVLVGHAYAPEGRATPHLVARLEVGEYAKAIGVTGDRVWTRTPAGLRPGAPVPFARMPLSHERAVRSPLNPVGLDPSAPPVEGAPALPNLEAVSVLAEGGLPGFGPIAPSWPGRHALAAGAPEGWLARAEGPAPPGFDFGYFNAAPRDQQLELLRATSRLVLENLHPEHARLETTLPPLRPRVFLVAPTGRASDVALRCDTLWIDTDRGIATLAWRGLASVEAPEPSTYGTVVVAAEGRGKELRARHIERLLREGGELTVERLATLAEPDKLAKRHDAVKIRAPEIADTACAREAAEPEAPAHAPAQPQHERPITAPPPAMPEVDDDLEETTTTGNERLPEPAPLRTEPPPAFASSAPVIPFVAPLRASDIAALVARDEPAASAAPSSGDAREEGGHADDDPSSLDAATPALEREPAPDGGASSVTPAARAPDEADASAPEPDGAPPRVASAGPAPFGEVEPAAAPADETATTGAPLASPVPAGADDAPHGVALERYARIAVALAAPSAARAIVLADEGLSAAAWADVERTWNERLQRDAEEGGSELGARLRAARAAAHAASAGPSLSVVEYARIAVAMERGEVPRVLAEHKMGLAELMRLQRSWTQRSAEDPQLATALAEAMEAARWE